MKLIFFSFLRGWLQLGLSLLVRREFVFVEILGLFYRLIIARSMDHGLMFGLRVDSLARFQATIRRSGSSRWSGLDRLNR